MIIYFKLEIIKKMRNGFRKLFIGLAFVVAAITVSSCATRESAINDLQNFSYELRDNSQRIGKLEGDCARYMVKGAKEGVVDKVLGAGGELQGILDALGIKM
mgnify:CR=1 FL=1